jgi:hypothetical protein
VQTSGANGAGDEFVEIFNPTNGAVDLKGWTLVYRASSGSATNTILYAFQTGDAIASGGYVVLGGSQYNTTIPLGTMASSLGASAGGIGLKDNNGVLIDAVAYGTLSNALAEGALATAPPSGTSIARYPNGSDTNANSVDFKIENPSTPGAPN